MARYGGEEIVALLPDTDLESALELAESMRKKILDLSIAHMGSVVSDTDVVTISIGLSTRRKHMSEDKNKLLKRADEALYQAKSKGRNRTVGL